MDTAGIDVGAVLLQVTLCRLGKLLRREFPNTPAGHRAIAAWLTRKGTITRVCLEATGSYGLDLALVLSGCESIELMVANPRAVRQFAAALMQRNKTDLIDADVNQEFAARMPFQRWVRPSQAALELRTIARRIDSLQRICASEKNRRHAAAATRSTSRCVARSFERVIRMLETQVRELLQRALALIQSEPALQTRYDWATSAIGIGRSSAIRLLGELAYLPSDMDPRQCVAHAGLAPRHHRSGTSVEKKTRVSRQSNRYLRTALFMPAMTARRHDPHLRAFADHLIRAGKTPLQALVAVMRKLLVGLTACFRRHEPFRSEMLFRPPALA
ncbi:MAG TPA: IS110 family transposase [Thermoanaerobaculia bacterium]